MLQNLTEFNCRGISVIAYPASSVYFVVPFYPWFKFYFPCFKFIIKRDKEMKI